MVNADKNIKSSKRNFVLALALLLIANIIMGVTLVMMSKAALREQIEQRMLDVSNTAASMLNGDDLRDLEAKDKGTPKYDRALEILSSFQNNIELDYIYGIREQPDGTFTFTIDPDEDPAEFGSSLETTDALRNAAAGNPDVDKTAHSDQWGRFYSAYSPVFDSQGKVAGIVGVDFNADWFDGKLNTDRSAAVILTIISFIIGVVLSFIIMSDNRKHFARMLKGLTQLDNETQRLDRLIMKSSIKKLDYLPDSENQLLKTLASGEAHKRPTYTEYEKLEDSIEKVYYKLKKYVQFVESEVYTDSFTGALNKAAYRNKVKEIGKQIEEGNAEFAVGFIDLRDFKRINTYYGYEAGDELMFRCSKFLKKIFGADNVYHVVGDEFIIVINTKEQLDMEKKFKEFEELINEYNKDAEEKFLLSYSKGMAYYIPGLHQNYREVFIEVKKSCYEDKKKYHIMKEQQEQNNTDDKK